MRRFRPPLWSWIILAAALALFGTMGKWQIERGQGKAAIIDARAAAARAEPLALEPGVILAVGRRYSLAGSWQADQSLLLDNQVSNQRVGYHLVSPVRPYAGGALVLVNRGWLPASPRREELPDTDLAEVGGEITGIWSTLPRPGVQLPTDACERTGWPRRANYPQHADLECIYDAPVLPGLLLLDAGAANGYVRAWTDLGIAPERHYGYAVQWFAMALASLIIFITLNLKRRD